MLRIHFTADDLARTRIAPVPDPMWESLLSLHMLTGQRRAILFREWREDALARMSPLARKLLHLAPPIGDSPDFLTPEQPVSDLESGIDTVLSTPRPLLQSGIEQLTRGRAVPAWAQRLADGDPEMLRRLGDALREYHAEVLTPFWSGLETSVSADRACRIRAMVTNGVEDLLSTLHPASTRWDGQVLHMSYPYDRDLYLNGRGLRLVPSLFCWRMPVTLAEVGGMPVLVYPIEHRQGWMPWHRQPAVGKDALDALVGGGRAALLRILADHDDGHSTSALARRVKLSLSTASEHATTLRNAGLTVARQDGRHVVHSLTPLARALVTNVPRV